MHFLITILAAFFTGFFASIVATGPVTFLIFRNSLLGKYNRAVAMIFGSSIMESIYCILALSVVSSLFLESRRVIFFSRIIGAIILFSIGIYLYKTDINKEIKTGVRNLSKRERARAFLAGFILVAINPTIILTWSAVATALISFKIITIRTLPDILFFSSAATLGMICGGLAMAFLIRYFKMRFPEKILNNLLKLIGVGLIIASFYLLISFKI